MDETQKDNQKPTSLEAPKDIEDLLKELPPSSKPSSGPIKPPPLNPEPKPEPKPITPQRPTPTPTQNPSPTPPPAGSLTPPPTSAQSLSNNPQSNFKSFVRTMGEDIEAAKKGQKPESKPFEIKPPPPGGPKIVPPPPPLKMPPLPPDVKLGPTEKSKLLELPKEKPLSAAIPQLPKKSFLNLKVLILILALISISAGAWYFLTKETKEVAVSTPTPTPTPIPTPKSLRELVLSSNQIVIPSTENFLTAFNNELKTKADQLNNRPGAFTHLNLVDEKGMSYSLSQIFSKLNINLAAGFLESLDTTEWVIAAYSQQETFNDQGNPVFNQNPQTKLALIIKVKDPIAFRSTLNAWENTMTNDLKMFFGVDSKKATSESFLDNFYQSANVRYRNFPYADMTIDYAIADLAQFNTSYFILTNSRESIYSAIDLLIRQ